MKAMLSTLLCRWNHKIEIEVRGLDKKYEGVYDRNMIGEEIENDNVEEP